MNDSFCPQNEMEAGLVKRLRAAVAEIHPPEVFAGRLEADLLARRAQPVTALHPRKAAAWGVVRFLARRRWAVVGASLLLAVAVILAILGPQRVWADLLHLLGYVPGVGFVDLDETRVLVAPVEVTRDGVTLRVEQVLAGMDKTTVVFDSRGLPTENPARTQRATAETGFEPTLRLPDGSTLSPKRWDVLRGKGTIRFPSLPEDVYRVTLDLPTLPLVEPGEAPEGWSVPLTLRPATGELVTELFPRPYVPAGAADTHENITLRVLAVAHTPEETVLQVQVEWPDPEWYFPHLGLYQLPRLEDDLGHVYQEGPPPGVGSEAARVVEQIEVARDATPTPMPILSTYEEAMSFAPVSPSAARLTLWVDEVEFVVPTEAEFSVDLGEDPQVGDYWPLDAHLTIAGFTVHVTGARLVEEQVPNRDGTVLERHLQLETDPLPGQENRELDSICLDGSSDGFSGGGCGGRFADRPPHLDIGEGQPIPTGHVRVQVREAYVLFRGPWQLSWTVPGTGEGSAAPVTLQPEEAVQIRSDVTLRVSEVTLTDRLTAVTIEGETTIGEGTLGWSARRWGIPILTLWWDPVLRDSEGQRVETRYLYDERNHRYESTRGTTWHPVPGSDERLVESVTPKVTSETLFFEPSQPFARRTTLHVPAVAVTLPGVAAFEVDVPAAMAMHPDPDTPERGSDPWPVDIPVEIAGYGLRFAEARLQELNGQARLVLASAPVEEGRDGQWLDGMGLAAVIGPNGQTVDLSHSYATAGPDWQGDGKYRVWVTFDVNDPATGAVQPGRYRVELDGIYVAVQGPWELTWDLQAP